MTVAADVLVVTLLAVGTLFVVVGTVGLLRFPDLATRLHAVAKADNLGLGLIVAALTLHAVAGGGDGWGVAAKLVLIWLLALLATAANSHLLARREESDEPAGHDGAGESDGGSS
ncbi:Na+/H+ antiporter subunit G [Serinibacter arcticus]|uniref:Na+/H+ antiporter subunit G n=1 Tax=Serinibacter arcticus TaxID=1655435 RepID=A0A2U1ZZP0_9MICO|nr:Na+/H+ antiporter subunit G [Serinibacter arcticus]